MTVALLLLGLVVWISSGSDRAKITALLNEGVELSTISRAEHPFERLKRAHRLAQLCTDDAKAEWFRPDGSVREISGRRKIKDDLAVLANRVEYSQVKLQIKDLEIDNESAAVQLTILLVGRISSSAEDHRVKAEALVTLVKRDGDWLIAHAREVAPAE